MAAIDETVQCLSQLAKALERLHRLRDVGHFGGGAIFDARRAMWRLSRLFEEMAGSDELPMAIVSAKQTLATYDNTDQWMLENALGIMALSVQLSEEVPC